jgi:hypothetical protein
MNIADIHCHSSLQPYSHKFIKPSLNQGDPDNIASIWLSQFKINKIKKILSGWVGVSLARQSNFKDAFAHEYKLIMISLYPVEKGFASTQAGLIQNIRDFLKPALGGMFTPFTRAYLNAIAHKSDYNYFQELQNEYNWYFRQATSSPNGATYQVINHVGSYDSSKINVILTVEGAHSFLNGNQPSPQLWANSLNNIDIVKQWDKRVFIVTFAHHYYNGLCTHAKSLFKFTGAMAGQQEGMESGTYNPNDGKIHITQEGYDVLNRLLDTQNGHRILIDIKHMSKGARVAYYRWLSRTFPDENIPIIASHTGLKDFYDHQISMDDDDLREIFKSNGLIGIEYDKRVLGQVDKNQNYQAMSQKYRGAQVQEEYLSFCFNIVSIALKKKAKGYVNCWDNICLGSDYDGLINAIGPNQSIADTSIIMNQLENFLHHFRERHTDLFIGNNNVGHVLNKIAFQNVKDFLNRTFQ